MGFAVRGLTYTRWGGITFDTGQIAKETNEVMFVQIYVQHYYTQIRPNSAGGFWT